MYYQLLLFMKEEKWKDIKGYEGLYQCSNNGNIRSLDRYVYDNSGKKQFRNGQMIIPRLNKNGYLQFALNKEAKRKMVYVHIIIANTFLDNQDKFETVNHKDGNKLNNCVENLEWCSYSNNNLHSYRTLNRKISAEGGASKPVYIIDTLNKSLQYFKSITDTSASIKLSHTQINRYIHSNKKWKGRYIFLTDNTKCVEDIERIS